MQPGDPRDEASGDGAASGPKPRPPAEAYEALQAENEQLRSEVQILKDLLSTYEQVVVEQSERMSAALAAKEVAEAADREKSAAKQRLEKELEIGARIQTCILPPTIEIQGLSVSARMIPASEVGGDYYDVFATRDGAWIGIGDVAGHGLTSGLVMLMVQSAVAALGRDRPDALPSEILGAVNAVLYDNIRHRLRQDEYVTLSLLRYHDDGRLVFAGAHEEMVVRRAATGRCETVPTLGTWVGVRSDIGSATVDASITLEEGDVLVLYTDGVTEAMDGDRRQFGLDRLAGVVEEIGAAPVDEIQRHILAEVARWSAQQDDDITVVVIRRRG
jgi:sigma-B regulation protein RsbU (phosphoserine phosphatase)